MGKNQSAFGKVMHKSIVAYFWCTVSSGACFLHHVVYCCALTLCHSTYVLYYSWISATSWFAVRSPRLAAGYRSWVEWGRLYVYTRICFVEANTVPCIFLCVYRATEQQVMWCCCRWLVVCCVDRHAAALRAWTWPCNASQPGAYEHRAKSNRRLREVTVSAEARPISSGNVSKPSPALCKVRGAWSFGGRMSVVAQIIKWSITASQQYVVLLFFFSVLTVLVCHQEWYPVCRKILL